MFYDKFIPSGTAKRLKRGKAITRNFNRTFPSSIYQFSKKRRQQHKTTNSGISLQWESKQNFVLQADYWKSPTPSVYVQIFKPLLPWEIVVLNPPPLPDTNAINALSCHSFSTFCLPCTSTQFSVGTPVIAWCLRNGQCFYYYYF